MKPTIGSQELVTRAESRASALTPAQIEQRLGKTGVLLVDLRDIRELQREGKIPGSVHVPRGMLEFWVDPDSPYYRTWFSEATEIILYCNKGWRSALAAASLMDMGMEPVFHMSGGMERWVVDIGRLEKTG